VILWCSYCQAFLREMPPFDDPSMTHGICERCAQELESGEPLVDRTGELRGLMTRILGCATHDERTAIPALVAEAREKGISRASLLVGMLQPALYRVGRAWQSGAMTVAEEHRFTAWCDLFFAHLAVTPQAEAPVDVLILITPENQHTIGPRFAAELLTERGIRAQVIVPGLPIAEVVQEILRLRPRVVGFSCALSSALHEADAVIAEVQARVDESWRGVFMVCGLATRCAEAPWTSTRGAVVAVTMEDVERVVEQARAFDEVSAVSR